MENPEFVNQLDKYIRQVISKVHERPYIGKEEAEAKKRSVELHPSSFPYCELLL